MFAIFYLQMILVGLGVGIVSSALGLGGGIVMVPAFKVVPGLDAHTAKATSLFIIVFVSAINVWHLGRKETRKPWDVAVSIGAGSIVGGYLGAWGTQFMSAAAVTWFFVVVVLVLAIRLLTLKPPAATDAPTRHPTAVGLSIGLVTGVIAGMTGIGGGNIMVPMVLVAGIVANDKVVLLSNMVMIATSLASTVAGLQAPHATNPNPIIDRFTYGHVCIALAPLIVVGSQLAVPLGKRINAALTPTRRRYTMAGLLFFIAIQQAWMAWKF